MCCIPAARPSASPASGPPDETEEPVTRCGFPRELGLRRAAER
jgi:hypothetical protein